jgi:hypothetical protein
MWIPVGLALAVVAAGGVGAKPPRPREGALKVGDPAPAFELTPLGRDKPVRLADLTGKPVVLIFGSCT